MRTLQFWCGVALCAGCGFNPVASKGDGLLPVSQPPSTPSLTQCAVPARLGETRVAVESGVLEGVAEGGVTAYLGVPYAAAPVGALRFAPPQPAACWTGLRDATAYGNLCAQPDGRGGMTGVEDCLALNVFAPSAAAAAKRPVLVFLHGGDGRTGGTHAPDGSAGLLDGAALAAAEDAVVVTVEWRLGAFGFTAHPALASATGGNGNAGLLDVIAALQWVQRNGAAFGADPGQVLLFGEAAGAVNVCALVTSPRAKGLFGAALMQSGACAAAPVSERVEVGRRVADAVGCSGAADPADCLRGAEAAALAQVQPGTPTVLESWLAGFGPTADGVVLPEAPLAALAGGRHAQVPLAVGSNADEFALFLPSDAVPSCAEYPQYLAQVFGPLAEQVEQRYPCDDTLGPREAAVAALTDAVYACPARRVARAASQGQVPRVYRYVFAHGRNHGPLSTLRAYHSAELPFLFETLGADGYTPSADESRLSSQMQSYWGSFARGEAPRAAGAPAWRAYVPTLDNALLLDSEVRELSSAAAFRCDFWDAISR